MAPRVIRQLAAADCGAACLAMVLSALGRHTTLAEARRVLPPSRDGVTAAAFHDAATREGLLVRGLLVTEPGAIDHLPLPFVAHWDGDHFVVVERVAADHVIIADPARGRRRTPRSEFLERFSGVALTCVPSSDFLLRRRERARVWRRFWLWFKGTPAWRSAIIAVGCGGLVVNLLAFVPAGLTYLAIDRVADRGDLGAMPTLALLAGLFVIVDSTIRVGRALLLERVMERIDLSSTDRFMSSMLALPSGWFSRQRAGDLLARVNSLGALHETITAGAAGAALDVAWVAAYLAALSIVWPAFAGMVAVFAIVHLVGLLIVGRVVQHRRQRELELDSRRQSHIAQMLRGIHTIKASGFEPAVLAQSQALHRSYLRARRRSGNAAGVGEGVSSLVRHGSALTLLLVAVHGVAEGAVSLGTALGAVSLAGAALAPLQSLAALAHQWSLASAGAERVVDVTDEPSPPGGTIRRSLLGGIQCDHLSVRLDRHGPLVLDGVTVHVSPGQMIAFVGESGSGKTTLIRALLGLVDPASGTVRFDGADVRDLEPQTFREQVGVVLQEPFVVGGRIRDNLVLDGSTGDDRALMEALDQAALRDDVSQMPLGLDTVIGESGHGLSGGQLQRLAIARAVYRTPRVLFLDEATSHLDTLTEAEVHASLRAMRCTRVIVAHRLSTVRDADLILVLHHGRVAEEGDHASLMALNGRYRAMVDAQVMG